MSFKTTTLKGDIRMRALNLAGSAVFVVYGCLLPAISTAVLNSALVVVNTYHLVALIKESKNQSKKTGHLIRDAPLHNPYSEKSELLLGLLSL